MIKTIDFYFDFASPYAYFALAKLEALAAAQAAEIAWRPFLLWAARKHFAMTPPMDEGPKGGYMPMDMQRSAAFHGLPFVMPDSFGKSSHLAARCFYGLKAARPEVLMDYTKAVFNAHFAQNRDIADAAVLAEIGGHLELTEAVCAEAMQSQTARDALAAAVERAVADKVWGSPFFILDGEPFFGADRLPQLEWRLAEGEGKS